MTFSCSPTLREIKNGCNLLGLKIVNHKNEDVDMAGPSFNALGAGDSGMQLRSFQKRAGTRGTLNDKAKLAQIEIPAFPIISCHIVQSLYDVRRSSSMLLKSGKHGASKR